MFRFKIILMGKLIIKILNVNVFFKEGLYVRSLCLFLFLFLKIEIMADLTQQQWREQMENDPDAVIVDVRNDIELEEGRIPGAIQMNIQNSSEFMEKAQELDKEKSYYLYCRSGGRSSQAALLFNSLGIEKTYNLIGGIEEWEGEIV